MQKWRLTLYYVLVKLTLNGDEEREDEERGEDVGGEGFVRERHLINSFDSCGKDKAILYIYISRKDLPVRFEAEELKSWLSKRAVSAMNMCLT